MFRSPASVRPTTGHGIMMALVAGLGYSTWQLQVWYAPVLPLAMLAYALIVVWRSSQAGDASIPDTRAIRHIRLAGTAALVCAVLSPLSSDIAVTIGLATLSTLCLIPAVIVFFTVGQHHGGTSRRPASSTPWLRTACVLALLWAVFCAVVSFPDTSTYQRIVADPFLRRITDMLFSGPPLPALIAILIVWATLAMRLDDGDIHAPEQGPRPVVRPVLSAARQVALIVGGIAAVSINPTLPWQPVTRIALLLLGAAMTVVGMAPLYLATLRHLPTLLHRVSGSTIPLVATAMAACSVCVVAVVLASASVILAHNTMMAAFMMVLQDVAASVALATILPAALEQWGGWRISLRVAILYTAAAGTGIVLQTVAIIVPQRLLGFGWYPDIVSLVLCYGATLLLLRAAPVWNRTVD